tara:strand:- start:2988 stop:3686 length:699 start_codon:yes stop_codon:yes gene_type:complete
MLKMFTKLLSSAIEMMIDLSKKQEPEEDVRSFEDLLTIDNVRAVMEKKGYRFFESGIYNLNIIGVRRSTVEINKFDDYLLLIYKTSPSNWVVKTYPITTDPGTYWLLNPTNPKGTAILIPGQYRSTWKIAKHQGKYEALCQRKPVKVWRDDNRDRVLDFYSSPEDEGYFGINIHRSNPYTESSQVDKWSAGCQVFKKAANFKEFMNCCNKSASMYGDGFTYTLLEELDFRTL